MKLCRWVAVVLVGTCGYVVSGPATAAEKSPASPPPPASARSETSPTQKSTPAPSAAAKAEARDRFDRGLRLYEQGNNAGAMAEFQRAYELIPNPLVLYNLGLVYAAMNRPVDAADALDAFLTGGGSAVSADKRRHAEKVRAEQITRIGFVRVETNVPATIEVDGIEAGHSPLATPIRVASGAHVIAAQAPGFLPTRREITLAGQISETVTFALQQSQVRAAQLNIKSALPGADVLVNGRSVGRTPLAASVAVPAGAARVELQRQGYRAAAQSVTLDQDARGELVFTLQEDAAAPATIKGSLSVLATEPDIVISIDGLPSRAPRGPTSLVFGPHLVRLERPGFQPLEETVTIVAGQELSIPAVLTPYPETRALQQEQARSRRTVAWSVLGAGVALAVGGGAFGLVSQGSVSDARDQLNVIVADQAMPTSLCYLNGPMELYMARDCGGIRQRAQDNVDSAELRRNLGFVGAGLGVIAAGIGVYLLYAVGDPDHSSHAATVAISARPWGDGRGAGGVVFSGQF